MAAYPTDMPDWTEGHYDIDIACMAEHHKNPGDMPYTCTRAADHDQPHAAGDGDCVLAMWWED